LKFKFRCISNGLTIRLQATA